MTNLKVNNPENLEFVKITHKDKVLSALVEIKKANNTHLLSKVSNIEKYAMKLSKNADVIALQKIDEGSVVGLIAFYANDFTTKESFITHIALHPEYQNMHLGKKLLELCLDISIVRGMQKVKLEVKNFNIHAIRFYYKNGFEKISGESAESIYMEKKLRI
ncbi:GNAT family N-acetyltransferase [Salirhabdus sp. Marseille-P4669]|uniref:GNAT family N-acetyltransferase n=1 Tax=Salirhabdus sp. Marseille-P4669 TaxID=2042310 RepID=UPI000C7C467F|nr:GNAT family N-acetyltransferase [Salirhabdus sp. Marseille-P4669]